MSYEGIGNKNAEMLTRSSAAAEFFHDVVNLWSSTGVLQIDHNLVKMCNVPVATHKTEGF